MQTIQVLQYPCTPSIMKIQAKNYMWGRSWGCGVYQ